MRLLTPVVVVFLTIISLAATAYGSDLFGTVWFASKTADGVTVKIRPGEDRFNDVTNKSGYYSIRNIPAGDYDVIVQYQGKECVKRVHVYPQPTQYNVICP
jgi:hypothetical protein